MLTEIHSRTKGTMISLSTRTRYCRATPVFDYESMSEQIHAVQLAALIITASRGLYMTSPKKEDNVSMLQHEAEEKTPPPSRSSRLTKTLKHREPPCW